MKYGTKHKGCTIIKLLWSRKEKTGSSKKIHETVCKQEYVENRTSIVKYRKGKYHENLEAKINYHKEGAMKYIIKKEGTKKILKFIENIGKKVTWIIQKKYDVRRLRISFNK